MGSWLYALFPSKTKWDRERVEMGLEVCALCASEIKQDKQRADKFQTFMSLLVKEDFKPSWVPFKYFPSLKMCTWSLHMRLVMPELAHKIQSYNLGKKISNLHGSLSWEPTQEFCHLVNMPCLRYALGDNILVSTFPICLTCITEV